MRKKLSLILTLVLVIGLGVGCQPKSDEIKDSSKIEDKDIGEEVKDGEDEDVEDIKLREFKSDKIEFDITYLPSDKEKNEELEKIIKEYLNYDKKEMGKIRYFHHPVTLNDDYENLVFAYLLGDYVSGTGGGTAIIVDMDENAVLFEFTQVDNPVVITEEKTKGWSDIIMRTKEGFAKMSFDGEKYPSNPTMEEHIEDGKISGFGVIAEEIEAGDGLILK